MGRTCEDCDQPAEVVVLDAYGPDIHQSLCGVCYMSGYRQDKIVIATSVLGVEAGVQVLMEDEQCLNCGLNVFDPSDRRSILFEQAKETFDKENHNDPH